MSVTWEQLRDARDALICLNRIAETRAGTRVISADKIDEIADWEDTLWREGIMADAEADAIEVVARAIHKTHRDWMWTFGEDPESDNNTRQEAREWLKAFK